MADALKQPLFLPQDMADLRTLKKHEVFLTLKRDLAMVSLFIYLLPLLSVRAILVLREFILTSFFLKAIQTTNIAKEWVDDAHKQMKEEKG